MGEFVSGFEASVTVGIGAPKNTPVEIIEKINREINAGLADANIKARLSSLGAVPFALSPRDYEKFITEETYKWGKAVKFSGAKPD